MKCYVCSEKLTKGNHFVWRWQTVQHLCSKHFFKVTKQLNPEIHEEINESEWPIKN